MNSGALLRLSIFISTITLLVVLISWTAHTSWQRTGELHEQLSAKQWQSFRIADHLQQTILGLNNLMLRYAAYREASDWTNFTAASQELSRWLQEQQPILSSQKERPFIDLINDAYVDYLVAATVINKRIYGNRQTLTRLVEFTELEKQSQRILDLGFKLSEAHQQSIDTLQAQSLRSLNILKFQLLGTLAILVVAGFLLAIVVYRDMIAPLQVVANWWSGRRNSPRWACWPPGWPMKSAIP